jgi:hypothetical protein
LDYKATVTWSSKCRRSEEVVDGLAGHRLKAFGLQLQRLVAVERHVTTTCMIDICKCIRLYRTICVEYVLSTCCKWVVFSRTQRMILSFLQHVFCRVQCVMCIHHFYCTLRELHMVPMLLTILYNVLYISV